MDNQEMEALKVKMFLQKYKKERPLKKQMQDIIHHLQQMNKTTYGVLEQMEMENQEMEAKH